MRTTVHNLIPNHFVHRNHLSSEFCRYTEFKKIKLIEHFADNNLTLRLRLTVYVVRPVQIIVLHLLQVLHVLAVQLLCPQVNLLRSPMRILHLLMKVACCSPAQVLGMHGSVRSQEVIHIYNTAIEEARYPTHLFARSVGLQ